MKKVIYAIFIVFLLINVSGWGVLDKAAANAVKEQVPAAAANAVKEQVPAAVNNAVEEQVPAAVNKALEDYKSKQNQTSSLTFNILEYVVLLLIIGLVLKMIIKRLMRR